MREFDAVDLVWDPGWEEGEVDVPAKDGVEDEEECKRQNVKPLCQPNLPLQRVYLQDVKLWWRISLRIPITHVRNYQISKHPVWVCTIFARLLGVEEVFSKRKEGNNFSSHLDLLFLLLQLLRHHCVIIPSFKVISHFSQEQLHFFRSRWPKSLPKNPHVRHCLRTVHIDFIQYCIIPFSHYNLDVALPIIPYCSTTPVAEPAHSDLANRNATQLNSMSIYRSMVVHFLTYCFCALFHW